MSSTLPMPPLCARSTSHFPPSTQHPSPYKVHSLLVVPKSALIWHLLQCLAYSRLPRGIFQVFTKASSRQHGTETVQLCSPQLVPWGKGYLPLHCQRPRGSSLSVNTKYTQTPRWYRNAVVSDAAASPSPLPLCDSVMPSTCFVSKGHY